MAELPTATKKFKNTYEVIRLFHIQAYDKMKLKQIFTILLIFLFCFYGISQVKAQNVSMAKDLEQVPVNNKEKIQAFPVEQSGVSLTILDDRPYPDIVEDKTLSSDTVDEKNLQEDPSVNEDDEEFVAEKETSSAAAPITPLNLAPNEEMSSIEEERGDQASVADNKQQVNSFDEEKSSSPEEERSSINHLTNTEENESRDREEEDISSHLSESFPVTVHENKTLSEFGLDDNEISGETSPGSENKQGIVTDNTLSDVKEKETPSASSRTETPAHFFDERESLAQEEEGRQTSKNFGEQHAIVSDEETDSQELTREITTSEIQVLPVEQSGVSLTTLDDRPSPEDIVEDKTPSSDTVDEKNIQEDPSVNEDDEKIVAEKDASPASSRAEAPAHSFDERESLAQEEEEGRQTSMNFGEQHAIVSDEETDSQEPTREITTSEIQVLPVEQSGVSLTTLDDRHSPEDIVEDKTPSSDTVDEKNIQEDPSVNEDDEKLVAEKEASSTTSQITPSNLAPNEKVLSIEEEGGDHAPIADNKQQENSFDEEKPSSPEEERSSISHLINTEENKSQDIEEEDISSHLSESFPVTVHENKTLSEFGLDGNEISGETSLVSEDKQGNVSDKDLLSNIKEKETRPTTSAAMPSTHSPPEKESLVQDKEDIQPQNREDEGISSSLPELPEMEVIEDYPSETEDDGVESTWQIWHTDPTQSIILAVVIALIAAKLGGWIAKALGFPGVVGKLILGMILGNIYLLTGSDYFDFLKAMPFLKMLSYFGTLVLLLTAGLHTDLRAIFRVGPSSVLVCLGGMVVPAGLGLIVSHFLLPDSSTGSKVLLAIVLCSTSTGLLFAILNELKIMDTIEGRVIVGATILTEIIVILGFGIVSGIVVKGGVSLIGISVSFGVAFFLLITAVIIIFKYGERFGNFLTNRLTEGLNIPIIVILSLLMAFMFGSIGLHTVIGAFIAGLFLRNVKLRNNDEDEHRNVESFIRPFYALLVPILFLRVGAQVDLQSFLNLNAILLGLNITGAAILGKLFCGICPIEKGTNRLLIGFGMAMKLEGTLILAGIGSDVGIFNDTVFSSIIMSIVLTSTICPFVMKMLLLQKNNTNNESICTDPKKTELVNVPLK